MLKNLEEEDSELKEAGTDMETINPRHTPIVNFSVASKKSGQLEKEVLSISRGKHIGMKAEYYTLDEAQDIIYFQNTSVGSLEEKNV